MKGISTVIATILMLMITIALAGTAYVYISGAFTSKQRTISLVDAYCVGTSLTFVIRNEGPDVIRAAEQTRVSVAETCTDFGTADIAAGATVTYTSTACGTNAFHEYRLVGPANALQLRERCA